MSKIAAKSVNQLKIVIVTLDVDGLRFCETTSTVQADKKRNKWYNKVVGNDKSCVSPALFSDIFSHLIKESADIFVVSTQDEDSRNTYLHSDFLPHQLQEIGYLTYQRYVIKNVGQLNQDNADNKGSALRASVFVKESQYTSWLNNKKELDRQFPKHDSLLLNGKYHGGVLAFHLRHSDFGHITILATNLPNADNIKSLSAQDYAVYQEYTNSVVQQGLIDIASSFWLKPIVPIDHVFLLGDFASDLTLPESGVVDTTTVLQHDFINSLKQKPRILNGMQEGVDNRGPTFYPTYRLRRDRTCDGSNIDCYDDTGFKRYGYPDRILYQDINSGVTTCSAYDRINNGAMLDSEHAGVIGTFSIKFT